MPTRRIRSPWAQLGRSSEAAPAPPKRAMNSRRCIAVPRFRSSQYRGSKQEIKESEMGFTTLCAAKSAPAHVSVGSDTRTSADVRDTTASPPEAEVTGSPRDVAEVPITDMAFFHFDF